MTYASTEGIEARPEFHCIAPPFTKNTVTTVYLPCGNEGCPFCALTPLADFIFDRHIDPPMPELRELTLCVGSLGELDMDTIRESISARLAVNSKLEKLVICLPENCEDATSRHSQETFESITLQIRTGSCKLCSRKGERWEHEVCAVFSTVPLVRS